MKKHIIILFLLTANVVIAQKKFNSVLKRQLDSVMVLDQKYRELLTQLVDPAKHDAVAKSLSIDPKNVTGYYWALQNKVDSSNVVFVEKVFDKYGYPGKTLVDTPANESAWYVIQHSKKIGKYLPMMKKAAEKGELPFHLYAMMLDRDLMYNGKEQIYGSQSKAEKMKDGKFAWFVWPIQDATHVNERRKKAGFDSTVEDNAKRLGVTYRVVAMNEVVLGK